MRRNNALQLGESQGGEINNAHTSSLSDRRRFHPEATEGAMRWRVREKIDSGTANQHA